MCREWWTAALTALLLVPAVLPAREFAWPTELPVKAGTPWQDFAQPTASGNPESALFGTTRNGGARFHEGLDIRASKRDRQGEPLDQVFAAMTGVVVHVVPAPNGPYGRYVVLLHQQGQLVFYTLYAHLRSVAPELRTGQVVQAGQALGVLGRSDAAGGFPKERAHLHFEIGLRLSDSFDNWYSRQKDYQKTPNRHGRWNGRNLGGTDPLPFLQAGLAAGRAPDYTAMLKNEPTAVTVTLATPAIPDFVKRHPGLVNGPVPPRVAGWKIDFAYHGLPVRWTPLTTAPAKSTGLKSVRLEFSSDTALLRQAVGRDLLARRKNGTHAMGVSLQSTLEILFNW